MPAPDLFCLLVKTKHTTLVVALDPGDTLQVLIPDADNMAALPMVDFTYDGNGVSVAVHTDIDQFIHPGDASA